LIDLVRLVANVQVKSHVETALSHPQLVDTNSDAMNSKLWHQQK